MAKRIFRQFKENVNSFELTEVLAGILSPGVYKGYDSIASATSDSGKIGLRIRHNVTGYTKVTSANSYEANPSAMVVFPNGKILHDTDEEILQVDQGTALIRYDVIVAELFYVASQNGSYVTYSVLKGAYTPQITMVGTRATVLNGITLTNPQRQVPVAIIQVNINATTFSQISLIPVPVLPLANANIFNYPGADAFARLDLKNTFRDDITFNKGVNLRGLTQARIRSVSTVSNGYIIIEGNTEGNEFIFNLQNNAIDIRGFRHATKDLGSDPATQIVPGTTIKVRFINTPGSGNARFYGDLWDNGIEPGINGFALPGNVNIKPMELYTIRLDSVSSPTTGLFSVSPVVTRDEMMNLTASVSTLNTNKYNNSDVLQALPWQTSGDNTISYAAFKIPGTTRYVVTLHAMFRTSTWVLATPLPEALRPSGIVRGYTKVVNTDVSMIIQSGGAINLSGGSPSEPDRSISVTYISG